jgi:hypothetical protein
MTNNSCGMIIINRVLLLLLVAVYFPSTLSFVIRHHGQVKGAARLGTSFRLFAIVDSDDEDMIRNMNKMGGDDGIIPPEESSVDYTGSVDWDAEWKKVVRNKDKTSQGRPGKDFYKSDAEIAAIVSYEIRSRLLVDYVPCKPQDFLKI